MCPMFHAARFAGAILFVPATLSAQVSSDPQSTEQAAEEDEADAIVVQATRSRRRLQDEPVRIEVLAREEIEEKMLMRPGNIAVILSETGGLRVQATSPALGGANIRVQGMDGRYTQLLADGLPLYGGQASSLGLLQIPPTDLGRVEVIKGAASALYGASALGGVINLVSRRPGTAPEAELLLNATSRDGQDATGYAAAPLSDAWRGSLTGGVHRQGRRDLDGDGWADIAGYDRWSVRPRLFWEGADGATVFLTAGAMQEDRVGGTLPGQTAPDGQAFVQAQTTRRYDAGLVAEIPVDGIGTAQLRAAANTQRHRHRFGESIEPDRHGTMFVEASLAGGEAADTSWVGGVAYQYDRYRSEAYAAFDYDYRVPGVFGQVEQRLGAALTLSGSARVDVHNRFGTQFSPRVSLLYRPGRWTIRASGGRGFYAPTPFVDEIEAAGLSRLEPLGTPTAEDARTASLDVGYAGGGIEANFTLFASDTRNRLRLDPVAAGVERVRLVSIPQATRIRGAELLLRKRWRQLSVTGSYMVIDATEADAAGGRRIVPLTPRHSGGIVAMWEKRDVGRLGFELYYTGRQALEDNPYRSRSRPYFEMGLLGEIAVGPRARLFVNAENILGVRQTNYDPLVRPSRAIDGRWTVDGWAPTEGFVLNGGVRLKLGRIER